MLANDVEQEATRMLNVLQGTFPQRIRGREAVKELKEADYNWKQMEWQGWYFEYKSFNSLKNELGGMIGPTFGSTEFDYQLNYVWDLKAHSTTTPSGNERRDMYLNDKTAIEDCIRENGGIGFIVAHGDPEYDDDDRSFYHWHQELKGGKSDYVKRREERDAPSRERKKAFPLNRISAYFVPTIDELKEGEEDGWIRPRSQGRNADGSERPKKYALYPDKVPPEVIAGEIKY
jgi:hypothetical protein